MKPTPASSNVRPLAVTVLLGLALAAAPAWAQYKVVAPDGSVTYTDRPPVASNLRITPIGRTSAAPAPGQDVGLPLELRQAVARYPVTLFTTADCPPCEAGRKLLQQRGVPHAERTIGSEDDQQALERLVGGRTVPSLNVGAQPLRGFNEADWGAYLDAAGYPKDSKLPRNWPAAAATPLVGRASAPGSPQPGAAPPPERRPADSVPPASGPRF